MKDIPLHDIKPLAEVPDNSLLILMIIGAVIASMILIILVIWIWKKFKEVKEINLRKVYMEKIHNVDTDNAKQAAYEISEYGRFVALSEKEKRLLDDLNQRLSQYKYKKSVEKIDKETLGYFHVFLEVLDAT